jgi:hypothetical protein
VWLAVKLGVPERVASVVAVGVEVGVSVISCFIFNIAGILKKGLSILPLVDSNATFCHVAPIIPREIKITNNTPVL